MQAILKKLFSGTSIQRTRDLENCGINRPKIRSLVSQGILEQSSRGLYTLSDSATHENRTLAEVAKKVPNGVICLLSALRFHELTTQSPHEVWLALKRASWKPSLDHTALRITYFSEESFAAGQEERSIEGVTIHITNPAKTVADCFKYRNKIGFDVAIESLREARKKRLFTTNDIMHYARICRVSNVMKPYLESLS
jgi:predicted transcriptional regulator of viral defense system